MRAQPLTLCATLAAAIALAGCGVSDPYQHPVATTTRSTISTRTRPSPYEPPRSGHRVPGAVATLRRYATLSINWSSRTLADQQRELEALATGGARAQAAQTAATYGAGSTLQRSGVADRGQITSIAAGQGPKQGWWVITTLELTTGRGDYRGLPRQPHIYYARLTRAAGQWRVTTWSPQN